MGSMDNDRYAATSNKERARFFSKYKLPISITGMIFAFLFLLVWFIGSHNPQTSAGYTGYLVQRAIFGKSHFAGLQVGPTSAGRTWLLDVVNVNTTPFSIREDFSDRSSVLSKDNLNVSFAVTVIWRVRASQVKDFVERYTTLEDAGRIGSTGLLKMAYDDYLQEPLRTFSRNETQKCNGLEIKDKAELIGNTIKHQIEMYAKDSPFEILSINVGNIQYPEEVSSSVALKLKTTQDLERKDTEIQIAQKEKQKRIVDAEGIAKSMEIINNKLTSIYLQHEAIEAQKLMVGSPNHSTIYIPVGNMGVPLVGTFKAEKRNDKTAE